MKKLLKHLFIFLFLIQCPPFGGWGDVYAQLYPVQVTPIFNSPYSVKLSDYATSIDTKLQLLINPTDIAITNRQVRLKFYLQGNGINAQSSDYIQGERHIFINGGELQTLTNVDIAALFRLENLQGISPAQYANPLPEGMYSFCFELYDFVTNQKISQKSCANLYLVLNDPPLLNTPQRNELIAATEFPNILFTWTPRQINATNVSYKFELKQLFDPTLDPQIAFQMAPVLHEETLFATALVYNLSMPILTPGMRYAWRVKAISTSGLSENAVFKNDGYSEIYSFKYTAPCPAPTFLLSETQSSKSAKITWQGVPEHTLYQLQYKKQNVANARWFSSNSLNTQSLLTNLEPGTTYEFRVGASCDSATEGIQSFTYSGSNTFTTPTTTNGVPAYSCGIVPQISIQNQNPITNLIQSETFTAGDFPVTILELEGHNPYSGRGYIVVPYLADTKIAVEFKDIVINTDYQLISGVVETSYDPEWGNMLDINILMEDIKNGIVKIKDFLINYSGNEEDKTKAVEYHVQMNEMVKTLLDNENVPQDIKNQISEINTNTKDCWENLEKAIPCNTPQVKSPTGGGPRMVYDFYADNFDCCTKAIAETASLIESTTETYSSSVGCNIQDPEGGCSYGIPLNNGDYESMIKLLKELKTAYLNKTAYTYQAHNTSQLYNAEIQIGDFCYDEISAEFTTVHADDIKVKKISYKKDEITVFSGAKCLALNFDDSLIIKITPQTKDGLDISKQLMDNLVKWLNCKGNSSTKPETKPAIFPITGTQLHAIFENTPIERCNEVATLINKYSDKFEINTPLRMSHFLGQIGVETNGLKSLKEIPCYKVKSIRANFGYSYYCDLYVGFDCINLDACATTTKKVSCNQGVPTKNEAIKTKYICTPALFDYVYSCSARLKEGDYDLGNGPPSSKDGSTFLGRGFIQLTGKYNYEKLSDAWNEDPENTNNKKYFHIQTKDGGHIDELETNPDVAMKASMYYWQLKDCNKYANNDDTSGVTKKVKGSDDETEVKNRGNLKANALLILK